MFKLIGKKIFYNFTLKNCVYLNSCIKYINQQRIFHDQISLLYMDREQGASQPTHPHS